MFTIANALENDNPFAYLLLFVILYPPIAIIIMEIIEKIKNRLTDKTKNAIIKTVKEKETKSK